MEFAETHESYSSIYNLTQRASSRVAIIPIAVFGLWHCLLPAFPVDNSDPCERQKITGNTGDIIDCARKERDEADDRMNKVYKKLLSKVSHDLKYKKDIYLAQDAWLRFRAKHCHCWSIQYAGGTIMPAIEMSCLAELTNERTKQLKKLLKSVE